MNADGGFLGRFRHQHFLLFLIAHFQRRRCTCSPIAWWPPSAGSTSATRRPTASSAATSAARVENFLRFEHRYWFHEISNQAQARELFQLARQHLDLDVLYREMREELQDMGNFLEVEAMRRQNETVVRLTVVTIFGLIGTVTTGFLGMNLFAWAEHPTDLRILAFGIVALVTVSLTLYTVVKSSRLSEFLDALSDEQVGWRGKLKALATSGATADRNVCKPAVSPGRWARAPGLRLNARTVLGRRCRRKPSA